MSRFLEINDRRIGPGYPVYIVAEMSANHGHDYERAVRTLEAAKAAGADAIKLQTYTADTLTIRSDKEYFRIEGGTLWDGRTLHDLYQEAYTPWDWQPKLKAIAAELGIDLFSTPFDDSAVDFLAEMGVPAYKIASFELVDLQLIERVAAQGRPIIMSTGMATLGEIDEAVRSAREAGATEIALLKCSSAYPASPDEINLRSLPHLADAFNVVTGLSDHTMGIAVPVGAVAMGACIIEKHFTLSRSFPEPDSAFSLEPEEFSAMVAAVRTVEKALGEVRYETTGKETSSKMFRRSLFVVKDMKAGEVFSAHNVRSIRPGHGLAPRYFNEVLGRRAATDLEAGTPLAWDLLR